jgi:hypothetical protein
MVGRLSKLPGIACASDVTVARLRFDLTQSHSYNVFRPSFSLTIPLFYTIFYHLLSIPSLQRHYIQVRLRSKDKDPISTLRLLHRAADSCRRLYPLITLNLVLSLRGPLTLAISCRFSDTVSLLSRSPLWSVPIH